MFTSESRFLPKEGWALFDRPAPSRLNAAARSYLVELFNAGKENKNNRVSPETAEMMVHDKFPTDEDCWLTVKQVNFLNILQFLFLFKSSD